jgi:hypothetical protein
MFIHFLCITLNSRYLNLPVLVPEDNTQKLQLDYKLEQMQNMCLNRLGC